jgi:hypothetical protein
MDQDRRIRFLIAPTLFVASLIFGAMSDQPTRDFMIEVFKVWGWSKLIGLIAGGGLVVFVSGYVIGTWTYFVLRLIFRYRPRRWGKSRFHEVAMSEQAFEQVWKTVASPSLKRADRWQELSAGVAFDHGLIRKNHEGIHQWLVRRWNAFNIAATSFWGLVLAFPIGCALGIPVTLAWWSSVTLFAIILLIMMSWAWCDAMNMLEFMASSKLMPKEACRCRPGLAISLTPPAWP